MKTNLTALSGLIIIYIFALLHKGEFWWMIGILLIMAILFIRNMDVEIEKKKERVFSIMIVIITLASIFFGIIN
ncbi:MAG: hypothetical protein JXQ65_07250 [Candidatus Marinimicrobia bacterium]|nr:hypothetical protein [Candidatus Neomarinimicrobiota bacterium]